MSLPKPNLNNTGAACAVPDDEHPLAASLRDIVMRPQRRSIGDLAAAIEHSLAELSLLKDRLDLIDTPPYAAEENLITDPSSGANSAPGYHPRGMARRG